MRRAVTVVLAVAAALLAVPSAVRLVGDHGHLPWVLLAVAVPFTVLPLIVLVVLQLVVRRRRLAALTLVPLVLIACWYVPLFVGAPAGKGSQLTVMTANLRYGEGDPFRIVQLVRAHHVDLLATEELTVTEVNNLRGAGLETELPYFTGTPDFKDGPDGSGLWSRYPLTKQADWPMRFNNPGALVQAPSGSVLVRVVHAAPPVAMEKGTYRGDYEAIRRESARLPTSEPTIVLGDFNATLDNSLTRSLGGGHFRDAGEKAGSGLLRTWGRQPGSTALLDLDHVFVDDRIGVRSTSVADVRRSDHDALIARLVVH
jgi:endonuclease/exonuclease/phosphatase (EEP) superfamily protein YafD